MGKTFVRLFRERGIGDAATMAECEPEDLLERLHAVNRTWRLSSVVPPLKGVAECVETARGRPKGFEA